MSKLILRAAAAAGLLAFAAGGALAQARIGAAPAPGNKAVNQAQASTFGLPRTGGLVPPFPAGITAGTGLAAAADPSSASGTASRSTTATDNSAATALNRGIAGGTTSSLGVDAATASGVDASATSGPIAVGSSVVVTGGGAYPAMPGMPATAAMGAGPAVMGAGAYSYGYGPSVVDTAGAFIFADANRDGDLTRAEATRLAIMPMSFEDMDRNRDGMLSRFEFDDAVSGVTR